MITISLYVNVVPSAFIKKVRQIAEFPDQHFNRACEYVKRYNRNAGHIENGPDSWITKKDVAFALID